MAQTGLRASGLNERQRIANERARSNLDVEAMAERIHGGPERLQRLRHLRSLIEADPVLNKRDLMFLNHTDQYNRGLQMAARFHEFVQEHQITDPNDGRWVMKMINVSIPTGVHYSMFLSTLMNQTTPEQQERFLHPALAGQYFGAYAQTELGHGSNVRGLETTATFVPGTDEWIIHSPTLTSTKWWPGGLGRTANCCVLHARTIIKGVDHGIHAFFVQLRDLDTHEPLPGRIMFDIGPKVGFATLDNGALRLDNVRVPRENMLMGYQQVLPDGTYVKPPNSKLGYGTMVLIRSSICKDAGLGLARAVTIATRYSAVRVQGGTPERAVLDYQEQQAQLLPLLCAAYACHFTGVAMFNLYERMAERLAGGDLSLLAETHASSAGVKALATYLVSDGIETCRRLCGGHGYSMASGLVQAFQDYVSAATLEGTREVLSLQTARYLIKCATQPKAGQTLDYLTERGNTRCNAHVPDDFSRPEVLVKAFAARARTVLRHAVHMMQHVSEGKDAMQACMVDLIRASEAHCEYTIVRNFADQLSGPEDPLAPVMALFSVWTMRKSLSDFRDDDYLSSEQGRMVHAAFVSLLPVVRAEAVALTDAWDFSDQYLNSAIGCYDGDVYRRLYEWAQDEPLNATKVAPGHYKYMKPIIDQARSRL